MYDIIKIKEMSLEALLFFDRFCKDNNLEYAIAFGTELGCVRHGGFIPWDDDVDVDMPVEDYLRLKKVWKKKSSTVYFLQTKKNELFKPTLFYQLRKNGTTWIDPGCENVPMHWGIAIIDIFPVYHMPKNKFLQKVQRKLYNIADKECMYSWFHRAANRFLHEIHRLLALIALGGVLLISFLSKKSDSVFYPDGANAKTMKLSDMYPAKSVIFEKAQLMGHANSKEYLTQQYGDYMTPPPESERAGHHFGIVDLENDYTKYVTGVK